MKDMDCEEIRRDAVGERYVQGSLSEAEREQYERHFFACDACLAELEALQGLRQGLPASRSTGWRMPVWAWGVAACLVLAVGVRLAFEWRPVAAPTTVAQAPAAPGVAETPSLRELAGFPAPGYTPVLMRGTASEASRAFEHAMELYQKGEYARAANGLRKAATLDHEDPAARFYLGMCELLSGRDAEGIASLRRTIALGETDYRLRAHFYLAKALLKTGRVADSRRELATVAGSRDPLRAEARQLLDKLTP